jgi:hypothetical protein
MSLLRNVSTNVIAGPMTPDSVEYQNLIGLVDGNNRPVWEDCSVSVLNNLLLQVEVPAVAAGADATTDLGSFNASGTIARVAYYPVSTITGQATNFRTFSAFNATASITPATLAASASTVVLTQQWTENDIPLSGTPSNLVYTAGDDMQWKSIHTATGLADPGGLVLVQLLPTPGGQDFASNPDLPDGHKVG